MIKINCWDNYKIILKAETHKNVQAIGAADKDGRRRFKTCNRDFDDDDDDDWKIENIEHEEVTLKEIYPARKYRCHSFEILANVSAQVWIEMGEKIVGICMTGHIYC